MTADSPTPIAPRVPLGRRLAVCFFFLFAALCTVTAIAWVALDRIQRESGRIAERYLPQYERVSQVQILMFRISLEARHAMLVTTPEEKAQTVARIQGFRSEMLQLLEDTERAISTDEGRQRFAAIREADRDFWRLGGEVLGKVQAGDVAAAFAQLNTDLVPARDRMVAAIALQREWQRTLATQAAQRAEFTATSVQIGLIALVLACGAFAAWLIWKLQRALRGALRRARDVTRRIAGGVEAGDEADDTPPDGDAFAALFASIAEMQQRLGEAVSRVHSTAANIARTAAELDQANLALQATTEQQSGTVAGTRDSAHRMADAVRESADHADNVSQLAGQASQVAVAGGEAVGRVVGQMQSIDESSRRIRDIVGVIDGIAFQTNILALNAAVEAARAGEQGRGFAVVASEVRSLAQRSAAAAREVKSLIEDSVERVAHGAEAATQAGQTMQSVVGQVDELSRLMNRIAETAGVQRAQAQAMGDAVGAMEGATQRNAAVVEQSRNAAAALRAHAAQLEAAVAVFGQARA